MSDGSRDDYKIGHGRPPAHARFKKGQSGNPKGRPKRKNTTGEDVLAILDEPITITQDGKKRRMQPKEVALTKILQKAIAKKDLRSIVYLLDQFQKHGVLDLAGPAAGGVLTLPNTMPFSMALLIAEEFGEPPWTKQQIDFGRDSYIASRSDEERQIDGLMGYEEL